MHQVASEHKSCSNTLIANARDQVAAGREPDKTGNSAYCKARQRLTEESIKTLFSQSGENPEFRVKVINDWIRQLTSLRRISAEASTYKAVREVEEHLLMAMEKFKTETVVVTYKDGDVYLFEQVNLGGFVRKHQYHCHLKNIRRTARLCEKIAKEYLQEKQLAALCGPSRFQIATDTVELIKDLKVSA